MSIPKDVKHFGATYLNRSRNCSPGNWFKPPVNVLNIMHYIVDQVRANSVQCPVIDYRQGMTSSWTISCSFLTPNKKVPSTYHSTCFINSPISLWDERNRRRPGNSFEQLFFRAKDNNVQTIRICIHICGNFFLARLIWSSRRGQLLTRWGEFDKYCSFFEDDFLS